MKIELDANDVEAIARHRFSRRYGLVLFLWLIAIVLLTIAASALVSRLLISFPLAMTVIGAVWWIRNVTRAERELVKSWKEETDGSSV